MCHVKSTIKPRLTQIKYIPAGARLQLNKQHSSAPTGLTAVFDMLDVRATEGTIGRQLVHVLFHCVEKTPEVIFILIYSRAEYIKALEEFIGIGMLGKEVLVLREEQPGATNYRAGIAHNVLIELLCLSVSLATSLLGKRLSGTGDMYVQHLGFGSKNDAVLFIVIVKIYYLKLQSAEGKALQSEKSGEPACNE